MRAYRIILLALTLAFLSPNAAAQQPTMESGLALLNGGKFKEAESVFRAMSKMPGHAGNAEVWNRLGLAHMGSGDHKDARKAFEKAVALRPNESNFHANLAHAHLIARQTDKSRKAAQTAVKLDPKNVGAHYVLGSGYLWDGKLVEAEATADEMIRLAPGLPQAYMLKYDVLLAGVGRRAAGKDYLENEAEFFGQAIKFLETGLARSGKHPVAPALAENLENARAFYSFFSKRKDRTAGIAVPASAPEPGVTPFKLISKPKANYTDKARQALVQGSVKLAVLLGSEGKVRGIIKLSSLGHGLDEEAMRAARAIKFIPKMKDGKPVEAIVTMEYSFSFY